MSGRVYFSKSPQDTKNLAAQFAKKLVPADIVALYGELGAGKTTFIQGLAAALGYKGRVFSPTFIFIRPYKVGHGKIKTLYHIDLYRVERKTDLETLGVEEFLNDQEAICMIEWPEKIEDHLPKKAIKIQIEVEDETKRKITIKG